MITDQASALSASRIEVEKFLQDNWFGTVVPCLGMFIPYPPNYYLYDEYDGEIREITTPDGGPLTLPLGFPSPKKFRIKRLWNLVLDRGPVSFIIKLSLPKYCQENPFNFYIAPRTITNFKSEVLTSKQFEKYYPQPSDSLERIETNQFFTLVYEADWPTDNYAVAIYEKNNLGRYQFSDFRTPSFRELNYPDDDGLHEVIIPIDGPIEGLTLNTYYQFKWGLTYDHTSPRKYKVVIDKSSEYTKINPQKQVEGFFKRRDSADNADDLTPMMKTIINELTASSDGTFIYELLQNANDYPEEISSNEYANVDVEFILTANYLICRHNGKFFTARDIAGVCKVGDGSKSKKKNAIGYKGIGFKTVFRDHDYVYINTGDYRFRFEEAFHRRKKRPWQIMPIWTEDNELDPEIREIIVSGSERFRVQTVMRPKDKAILRGGKDAKKNYQGLLHDIFRTIRDIIFIPNIQSVTVRISGEDPVVCTKENSDNWVISKPYEYILTQEEQGEINKEIHTSNEIPPKYEDFDDTRVLFACEKDGSTLKAVENATVNCYLPTQAQFGFPFLMNTDMVPSGDRNELKRNIKVNEKFAYIAGAKFAEWLKDLLVEGYDPSSVFDLVPDFENCRQNKGYKYAGFITAFENGFLEALKTLQIVPVSNVDGAKDFITLKEALYDATGISAEEIMSDDELCRFTGLAGRLLPIMELRGCDSFKKLHSLFKENPLTVTHLLSAFNNDDFKTWLKDEDHNCNWLHFILGYREKSSFANCEMFIDEADGSLKASQALYLDVEKYKGDLDFLHDKVHRLNQKGVDFANFFGESDTLKTTFKWLSFSPETFVNTVLLSEDNKAETIERLKTKENSIKFVHFLATADIKKPLSNFPLFADSGCLDSATGLMYFNGNLAQIARKKVFIKQEWFNIVSDEYLLRDKETVEAYLKKNGVKDCTFVSLYDDIILKENHLNDINVSIDSSLDTAIDFFEFLRWDKKHLQDKKLDRFHLAANDAAGTISFVSPDENSIFFESIDFDEYSNKTWADSRWMYSLHSSYFKNDADDADRKSFLKDKFGIKALNPSTFFKRVIKKHLDEILKKVSAPENENEYESRRAANLDFISFVCRTASSAFADENNPFSGKSYPFINSEGIITKGPSSFKRFYLYSEKAVSLQGLDWLPDNYVSVVSSQYIQTETPAVCLTVLGKLGLVEFSPEDFLTNVVTANLSDESLVGSLSVKEKNLSFHKYFKDHRALFSPTAMAGLTKAPVFNSMGVLVKPVTGQELLNDALITILDDPNISVSFDNGGIGLEYQDGTSADNKAYWVDCLGAKQIESDRLVQLLTTGNNEYAEDLVNIAFWRLVQSLGNTFGKTDIKSILRNIPIKYRIAGQDTCEINKLADDTPCYIAKEYFTSETHIEDILKDYSPVSIIVSPDYMQDGEQDTKAAWFKMWEKGGFLSSNDDIIRKSIVPSLESRKDDFTPQLIFENQKFFDLTQAEVLASLAKLNVKTRTGDYLPITTVNFLGDGLTEPMSYIKLSDEISNDFTQAQCTFFRRIAEDVHSVHRINDNREWATRKVKQYLGNQDPDIHDKFVKDAITLFESSQLDLDIPFDSLLLKDKSGMFRLGTELTLGTLYGAEICDFERFGIDTLSYISDHYLNLGIKKTILRDFFSRQVKVHREFREEDIPLLKDNHGFAVYLWSEYIKTRSCFDRMKTFVQDGVLNDTYCVPRDDETVDLPKFIYSESLQEFHRYISDAEEWYVCTSIPSSISFKDGKTEENPIFSLPLLTDLEKKHCYEVLLNSDPEATIRTLAVSRLIDLHKQGEVSEEEIAQYKEDAHALWLNGENNVSRIDCLYGIDREDTYHRRHFQTDGHIIHDDLLRGLDYDAACTVLGVKVLHEDDFRIVIPDQFEDETNTVVPILKRKSILLATAIDGAQDLNDDWPWVKCYNSYKEDAENLHFYKCEDLSIECKLNPEIKQSDVINHYFDKETSSFYYLYGWQDKLVFTDLVKDLCKEEALTILCGDDFEIVKKIIDENLVGKRLVDFVKKYCSHYSNDPEFRRIFHDEYPSVAEQLGWDIIQEKKTEIVSYREKVAFGNEEDRSGTFEEPAYEEGTITEAKDANIVEQPVSESSGTSMPSPSRANPVSASGRDGDFSDGQTVDSDNNIHTDESEPEHTESFVNYKEEEFYPEPDLYGELGESVPDNEIEIVEVKSEEQNDDQDENERTGVASADNPIRTSSPGHERSAGTASKREETEGITRSLGSSQWQRPRQLDNAWVSEGPSINPIRLEQSDFSDAEYETLSDLLNVDREQIADQNYLARKRFWDSLRDDGLEMEQDPIDFIKNDYRENGRTSRDIPLTDGRYIHRCSAAKGILYISPSIWNKVKSGRCIICVYAGKRASMFKYFYSQEMILDWVKNTAIFIQVTGKNKGEIMDKFYSGSLKSRTGDYYAMIPIKSQGASDVFFTTSAADLDKATFDID